MPIIIIKEGDKGKKGNMECPQCGEVVLVKNWYGDPPKCGGCGVPYVPILRQTKYM